MIEANLKTYYDWALLHIGAWSDVTIPTVQVYGGDLSQLRAVSDPNYVDGRVWEAARKDFVWNSGINYVDLTGGIHDPSPVGIPEINSSPTSVPYNVNYPMGQIIFDDPIPASSTVKLSYAHRYVQTYMMDDLPGSKSLQFNSYRNDSPQFEQVGTGEWSIFGQQRVQLPAVMIETEHGKVTSWEIGTGPNNIVRDVNFYILAETSSDRNNLMDIFSLQNEKKVPFFDVNRVTENSAFPLNYRGELVGTSGYAEFISDAGYCWGLCTMTNATITNINQIHPQLYTAIVRTTMSIIG